MIGWAFAFLIVATISAILGWGGIFGEASGIAQMIFFVFLVLFLISMLMGFFSSGKTRR